MITLVCLIFVYSVIQSLFGVGVLLFGTPSLLLLGYRFDEVLSILIPCSLGIGVLQIWNDSNQIKKKNFPCYATLVVFVVTSLWVALNQNLKINLNHLMGGMLIFNVSIKIYFSELPDKVRKFLSKYRVLFFGLIGLVHGLTNMGGGLLSVFVGALAESKASIRGNIAIGYFLMGLAQIFALVAFGRFHFELDRIILLPLVSTLTFLSVGNYVFAKLNDKQYRSYILVFMLIFGVFLIYR